ncbi:MAG: fused MFS/spermidine synthase [Acidobacteria bacterium]|nr:fused MFS/spermidine synthase [Acidobacteriota bacterium]
MDFRSRISQFVLELTVFVCGALVMIYEINGSRILAPHIGTSTYVWTSLIGVILGALSLGYWYGGKLADRRPELRILASVLFLAAGLVSLTILVKDLALAFIVKAPLILEIKSLLAALFLFAPASVLLGFVTPFAVKLRTLSLDETGSTVGRLYALSTVGSIFGTFAAGFVLIPFVGSTRTLYLIAASLFGVALMLSPFAVSKLKVISLTVFLCGILTGEAFSLYLFSKYELVDADTQYNRVQIFRATDEATGRQIRAMAIDPATLQSKMFLDGDELATEYLKYYHLVRHFKPDFEEVLMIGGAGYSYPKDFLRIYPGKRIDTVEIDPKMTALARKHFNLRDDPRLKIIHEDGRMFLNRAPDGAYDAVFLDAFSALFSIPFHLTTREAAVEVRRVLKPDGVVIFNIGGALTGDGSRFFRAELATYREVFPDVEVFKVRPERGDGTVQNLIIVARASTGPLNESADPEIARLMANRRTVDVEPGTPILTDDLAPVEYYNSNH